MVLLSCSSDDSDNSESLDIGQSENHKILQTYYLIVYFILNLCSLFLSCYINKSLNLTSNLIKEP